MAPERFTVSETDSAFEALLLKKNGDPKTVQDLFECFVAMHHDQKSNWAEVLGEIRTVAQCVESHQTRDVNMTKEQFVEFMAGRDRILRDLEERIEKDIAASCAERRAAEVKLEAEIKAIWQEIHRDPRRAGDESTEDWGRSIFGGDSESWWQILTAWKTLRWAVGAAILVGIEVAVHSLTGG